jgi:hypothetical protein
VRHRYLVLLRFSPWAALLAAPAASGVIVAGGDGTQNTTAPAGLSNWLNVGYLPAGNDTGGSGVYIGNGWVLTAGHVQGGNSTSLPFVLPALDNGQNANFLSQPGVWSALHLPSGALSDLTVFKLNDDSRLASLPVVRFGTTPQVGTGITAVGAGWNRLPGPHRWQLDLPSDPVNAKWTDVTGLPRTAQASGYLYDPSHFTKRWGTNATVALTGGAPTEDVQSGQTVTRMFATVFDTTPTSEMQLVNGDSGGGVFVNNRLVGINLLKADFSHGDPNPDGLGQPANTAVFGNASYYGDVFTYVDQIASITQVHPGLDGDANLDGVVDYADFKLLYDHLNTAAGWTAGDFNLDGRVNFTDYQMLERNYGKSDGTAAGADLTPLPGVSEVPEPGGIVALGLAVVGLLRRRRR